MKTITLVGDPNSGKTAYLVALHCQKEKEHIPGWNIAGGRDRLNEHVYRLGRWEGGEPGHGKHYWEKTEIAKNVVSIDLFTARRRRLLPFPWISLRGYEVTLEDVAGRTFNLILDVLRKKQIPDPEDQKYANAVWSSLKTTRSIICLIDPLPGPDDKPPHQQFKDFREIIGKILEERESPERLEVCLVLTKADLLIADRQRGKIRLPETSCGRYLYFLERGLDPLRAGIKMMPGAVEYSLESALRSRLKDRWKRDPLHLREVTRDYMACWGSDDPPPPTAEGKRAEVKKSLLLKEIDAVNDRPEHDIWIEPILMSSWGRPLEKDPKNGQELFPTENTIEPIFFLEPLRHSLDRLYRKDCRKSLKWISIAASIACIVLAILGPGWLWWKTGRAMDLIEAKQLEAAEATLDSLVDNHPLVWIDRALAPHLLEGIADTYLECAKRFAAQQTQEGFRSGMRAAARAEELTGWKKYQQWREQSGIEYLEELVKAGRYREALDVLLLVQEILPPASIQAAARTVLNECAMEVERGVRELAESRRSDVNADDRDAVLKLIEKALSIQEALGAAGQVASKDALSRFRTGKVFLESFLPGAPPTIEAAGDSLALLSKEAMAAEKGCGKEALDFVRFAGNKVIEEIPLDPEEPLQDPKKALEKVKKFLSLREASKGFGKAFEEKAVLHAERLWGVIRKTIPKEFTGCRNVLRALQAEKPDPNGGPKALEAADLLKEILKLGEQFKASTLPGVADLTRLLSRRAQLPKSLQVQLPDKEVWEIEKEIDDAVESLCEMARSAHREAADKTEWLKVARILQDQDKKCDLSDLIRASELHLQFTKTADGCRPTSEQENAVREAFHEGKDELLEVLGNTLSSSDETIQGAYAFRIVLDDLCGKLKPQKDQEAIDRLRKLRAGFNEKLLSATPAAIPAEKLAELAKCLLDGFKGAQPTVEEIDWLWEKSRGEGAAPHLRKAQKQIAGLDPEGKVKKFQDDLLREGQDLLVKAMRGPGGGAELDRWAADSEQIGARFPRLEALRQCAKLFSTFGKEPLLKDSTALTPVLEEATAAMFKSSALDFLENFTFLREMGLSWASQAETFPKAMAFRRALSTSRKDSAKSKKVLEQIHGFLHDRLASPPQGLDPRAASRLMIDYFGLCASEPGGDEYLFQLFRQGIEGKSPALTELMDPLCQSLKSSKDEIRKDCLFKGEILRVEDMLRAPALDLKGAAVDARFLRYAKLMNAPHALEAMDHIARHVGWLARHAINKDDFNFVRIVRGDRAFYLTKTEVTIRQYRALLSSSETLKIDISEGGEKLTFTAKDGPSPDYLARVDHQEDAGVYGIDAQKVSDTLIFWGARLPTLAEWTEAYVILNEITDTTNLEKKLTPDQLAEINDSTREGILGMTYGLREAVTSPTGKIVTIGNSWYNRSHGTKLPKRLENSPGSLDLGFRIALDLVPESVAKYKKLMEACKE
jgi:hypothetical protein